MSAASGRTTRAGRGTGVRMGAILWFMALYSFLCFQLVSLEARSGRIAFAITASSRNNRQEIADLGGKFGFGLIPTFS